ncbi:MAG TPA: hypothetical protein VLA76_04770 [Candidatus Angelobacter sp.]|nr:hypothetical protein [Candidatus Angelobacter sp.]
MSRPTPGRVLGWALLGWGLGHLALGRTSVGIGLLLLEVVAIGLVAWLTAGLADTSAYLVPFLAGVGFLVAWAWQAIHAYHQARASGATDRSEAGSPALALAWLTVPLLAWGAGFWLIGAHAATPAAALDRFVTAWTDDELRAGTWPASLIDAADAAAVGLGTAPDRFRDVRVRVAAADGRHATAVAEAIHYERRESRFLWVFPGSQLVPVADREVLTLELEARPAELPGGGDIGAVRWEVVGARATSP